MHIYDKQCEIMQKILGKQPVVYELKKNCRFKSKFHAAVREEWESGRNHHLSMGEAETPVS